MAGTRWVFTSGKVATGTAAKTIAQLQQPGNIADIIDEITISFEGVNPTDAPVFVEILRQGTAGTMSPNSPAKFDEFASEVLSITGSINATVEPAFQELLASYLVHPQTNFTWQVPTYRGIKLGTSNSNIGIRVTSGRNINCIVTIAGEE